MRDPDLEKTMATEQVITDLLAYCTRTNHTLKFSPGEVVREVRDSGSRFHTAAELDILVHEGDERLCHEGLVDILDEATNKSFILSNETWDTLRDRIAASKAALARERGA